MRSGGYDFQCLGPNGSQTPPAAFDYLQEKLGEKDAADYNGFHIERAYHNDRSNYVAITARQNSPQRGKQPVTFRLARLALVKGGLGYGLHVSRNEDPDVWGETDWSSINLYTGACEQGVKVLGASGDLRFRQMDRTELGAYAYLFGTGVETLDYNPMIDYEDLLNQVPNLVGQIKNPDQSCFGVSSLFTQQGEIVSKEETQAAALGELISTLRTLKTSAALPPDAREEVDRQLLLLTYTSFGKSDEEAKRMADSAVNEMRMYRSLIAAQQK